MMIYPRDDERAIRVQRMVDDWTASGLLQEKQRERMRLELQVDYRRTNLFLRLTLFLFAALIIGALVGLAFVVFDLEGATTSWQMFVFAAAAFYLAQFVISRYRAYRHGVEEAAAVASIVFFAIGCAMFKGDFSSLLA